MHARPSTNAISRGGHQSSICETQSHSDGHVVRSLRAARTALDSVLADLPTLTSIEKAGALLIDTFANDGRAFSCGNGGSMCDAIHFAEELTGRYRRERAPLPALAISDVGHLSCVGNDLGYERVFSRYLEAHGRAGDCLLALSTSGSSTNILYAAEAANTLRMNVIGLTGRQEAPLARLCAIHVCTPASEYADRVQELHMKILHILIELVERHFFPQSYQLDHTTTEA